MFKNVVSILRKIDKKYYVIFILAGLLNSIIYLFQILSPLYQKELLDTVITNHFISKKCLIFFVGCQIGIPLVMHINNQVYNRLKLKVDRTVFFYYFQKVLYLRKDRITRNGSGQYADIIFQDSTAISNTYFSLSLFDLLYSIIQAVIVFLIVIKWSWIFSIVSLSYVLISLVLGLYYSHKQSHAYGENRDSMGKMFTNLIDLITNNRVIRSLGIGDKMSNFFKKYYFATQKGLLKILNLQTIPSVFDEFFKGIGFAIILIVSLKLLISKEITYGMILAMISYYSIIIAPVNNILMTVRGISFSSISVERLSNIEKMYMLDNGNVPQKIILKPFEKLELNNLCYNFTEGKPIFDKLSMTFNKGITGLIGLSGEGKSSLIKAISQEIKLNSGDIFLNNINVDFIPLRYYLFKINILHQDMEIFDQDLIYNLVLNRKIVKLDQKMSILNRYNNMFTKLFTSLPAIEDRKDFLKFQKRLAKEKNIISTLEILGILTTNYDHIDKYNLYLKNIVNNSDAIAKEASKICFEQHYVIQEKLDKIIDLLKLEKISERKLGSRGNFISGGEKQRLILGRFLLRDNYEFVILDEPFTSLDVLNEKQLLAILKEKLSNKNGLLITHKINILLELADNLYVMENGKISQNGTHDELISKKGLYQDLINCYYEDSIKK